MTDQQLYVAVGVPLLVGIGNFILIVLAWLFANKRVDDTNTNLGKRVDDAKEVLLAEMKAFRVEVLAEFRMINEKIDRQMERHIAEYHK